MGEEEELYPLVEDFLKKRFGARWTGKKFGRHGKAKGEGQSSRFGHIDVFGIKQYKENFSNRFEVIGVEVKPDAYHFAKDLGQTLGYSIFCHRLFYAYPDDIGLKDQIFDFASKLGIGVIKINKNPDKTELLLPSKLFEPDKDLILSALNWA